MRKLARFALFIFLPAATLMSVSAQTVSGDVIVQHLGAADPTTESWVNAAGTEPVGPVFGDMGFDAWSIDDSGVISGSSRTYLHALSATQTSDAFAGGWQLSTRLRVLDVPDSVDFSVSVIFHANGLSYGIAFGTQADGDPIVQVIENFANPSTVGPSFVLDGSGGGYHLYDLVFDPIAGTADLFVDGVEQISDYSGYTFNPGAPSIAFGAQQSSSTGHANFNMVNFSTNSTSVPEPSSLVAFLLCGLCFCVSRRFGFKLHHSPK